MSSLAVDHDLTPLGRGLEGLATGFRVGDVQLAYVRYGGPSRVIANGTSDLVCWTIPLDGMDVSIGSDKIGKLTVGFVLGREDRTAMLPNPHGGAVVITTSEQRLNHHFRKVSGRLADPGIEVAPGPSHAPANGLIDMAWRYVAGALSLGDPPDALIQSLEEMLLTSLLLELPSRASRVLQQASEDRNKRHAAEYTQQAIDWADRHLGRPITLMEWAAAVGISVRHLQKSFQTLHGCTPTQYLLLARLERAHDLLKRPAPNTTVTRVAAEVGFGHLSRFAAAYRARYGQTPSETMRSHGLDRTA